MLSLQDVMQDKFLCHTLYKPLCLWEKYLSILAKRKVLLLLLILQVMGFAVLHFGA